MFTLFTAGARLRVRFSESTNDASLCEGMEKSGGERNLKVPTWPGALPSDTSSSPKSISSPSSDTALLQVRDSHTAFEIAHREGLAISPASDPHLPRSNSNDSISSSNQTQATIRKSSSSGQLVEKPEIADANFLATEVSFVQRRLLKVAGTCLSNCWRDFMWYKLLLMDGAEEEALAKKNKKRVEARKESFRDEVPKWKLASVLSQIRKEVKPVRTCTVSSQQCVLGLLSACLPRSRLLRLVVA